MIFNQLGNRIRDLRIARGFTLRGLGDAIGATGSSICLYEKGKRIPDIYTLQYLADALKVSPCYILTGMIDEVVDETEKSVVEGLRSIPEDARKDILNRICQYQNGGANEV